MSLQVPNLGVPRGRGMTQVQTRPDEYDLVDLAKDIPQSICGFSRRRIGRSLMARDKYGNSTLAMVKTNTENGNFSDQLTKYLKTNWGHFCIHGPYPDLEKDGQSKISSVSLLGRFIPTTVAQC
jgi:hypothetical protein